MGLNFLPYVWFDHKLKPFMDMVIHSSSMEKSPEIAGLDDLDVISNIMWCLKLESWRYRVYLRLPGIWLWPFKLFTGTVWEWEILSDKLLVRSALYGLISQTAVVVSINKIATPQIILGPKPCCKCVCVIDEVVKIWGEILTEFE